MSTVSTFCRYCGDRFRIAPSSDRSQAGGRSRATRRPPDDGPLAAPGHQDTLRPASLGAILRSNRQREVACFECGAVIAVQRSDPATLCPHCGAPVELADFDIRERLARRIRTHGNVVIHRGGGLVAGTVQCHHLTIYGEVSGRIDTTGTLSFQRSTRSYDGVRCHRLVIGSGCLVEFDEPAVTCSAEIEGHVRGEIHCDGPVRIAPNGVAEGRILARTLSVDPEGELLAEVELTRPRETEPGGRSPAPASAPPRDADLPS